MLLRLVASLVVLLLVGGCAVGQVPVGGIDQKDGPTLADLKEPKDDKGITAVGLHETIEGKTAEGTKENVYVLVNPLSNRDTRNTWWVQQPVGRSGDAFSCACQFGEGAQGQREYFAFVAVATDKTFDVGQMLHGIPPKMLYSKLKIVKRTH